MINQFSRWELLIGAESLDRLIKSSVIVFGVGGVGSFTIEALTRAGVGRIDIVDKDVVDITNLNRQIIALHSTVGKPKVDVMKERMNDINPDVIVNAFPVFYNEETENIINLNEYDYIVDAIDTVASKLLLIKVAHTKGIPIISSMGTGNKTDPTKLKISDISKTSTCPLARVIRRELRKLEIKNLKVLSSEESPSKIIEGEDYKEMLKNRRQIPSSSPYVPSVAGLIIASEVIKDLIDKA